jgi:hypothetical protein
MAHWSSAKNERSPLLTVAVLILLLGATPASAQVTQTGSITGTVTLTDGMAIPGVAIRATSTALQGERVTYSGENGGYVLRLLPPGLYAVSFEMNGMANVRSEVRVDLGQTSRADARLAIAATAESISVMAEAPRSLETAQLGTNLKAAEITTLPLPRTLHGIAALTPGVNTNTYNPRQIRINGSMAFDNLFLVDGTDINDTIFGLPNNLFIEDSIAETQVMTGAISAEYGRFTGGVVNVITKSGGNDLTGTVRADLTNPDWIAVTDFEKSRGITHADKTSEIFSFTLGGPVMRDRFWFFLAARQQETGEQRTLVETSIPYEFGIDNPRYEAKLTITPWPNHTIQGSWLESNLQQTNTTPLPGRTMDPRAFAAWRLPNERWAVSWNGIFGSSLFAEVKYSQKLFGFRDLGGTSRVITDSPFLTTNQALQYHAPFFDSTDPEDRDNEDLTMVVSYFADDRGRGSHDIRIGFDDFRSSRTGGGSSSSTGYVFFADFVRDADGRPAIDSNGRYIPNFVPGASRVMHYVPLRGAHIETITRSLFVSDKWSFNRFFTFDLGARHESVSGKATGGISTVDTDRLTPRLAASWDLRGDGRQKLDLTFAQYSGRYTESQVGVITKVANPDSLTMVYQGPAGQGVGFGPGFDLANYRVTTGRFPLQNVRLDPDIQSALVDEWTISGGRRIGSRGFARISFTSRDWSDFYEDYIDTTTGITEVEVTPTITHAFNNIYYSNNNESWHEYQAIQLAAELRPLDRWSVHAAWTHELRNHGNFIGEGPSRASVGSAYGDYPEIFNVQRHYPDGRLPWFQEHRLRLLNSWDQPLGAFGNLRAGLIYSYDSAGVYNLSTNIPLTNVQAEIHRQAGYRSTPASQTIYFGKLGAGKFEDVQQVDLALTYSMPLLRGLEPWIKLDVYNLLNADALVAFNTTVTADPNSPKDELGIPTGYIEGPLFGKPTSVTTLDSPGHVQLPREIRLAAGIRF